MHILRIIALQFHTDFIEYWTLIKNQEWFNGLMVNALCTLVPRE